MKKLKLILAFFAFSFLSLPGHSQQLQKTYDLGADDYGNMSAFDNNGDIFTVGSSNFTGAGGYDALLMKTDGVGTFQWHKQYGGSGTEFGTALVIVSDGIVIAGRSNSFSSGDQDVLLVKTDFNGDIVWAYTYGTNGTDYATDLATTVDNGFIIAGVTNGFGNGGTEMLLIKTDSAGVVEFSYAYGSNSDEVGYHVFQDSDNGFVLAGSSTGAGGAGMNDIYIVKTDSNGVMDFQLLIGTAGDDRVKRVYIQSGLVVLAGTTTSPGGDDDVFAGALNGNNLTVNWFNTYGGTANDVATDFVPIGDDGFAFAGFSESFGSSTDGLVAQLDTSGNIAFSAVIQDSLTEIIQDLTIGATGGLATAYTNSYGPANDIYLFRIGDDPLCKLQPVNLTVTPITPTINPALTLHAGTQGNISGNAVTLTQTSTTATVKDICAGLLPLVVNAGDDIHTCPGGQVQIGGNPSAGGGTPPYTYSWIPAAGLDDASISNPTASPATTTQYFLTVTDSTGATAMDSVNVSIGNLSFASISPPNPNICDGQNVTLTASGGVSYLWNTGDITNNITPFPPSGTTTNYSVVVTNASGCLDSAFSTVNSITPPIVTVSPVNPATCVSDSVMLSATGAQTYVWTPSAGLSDDSIPNPFVTSDTTITYTVTGYNGHCAGAPVDVTVTVTAICGLVADAGDDTAICLGGQIQIGGNPSALGGIPPFTYAWSPSSGLDDSTASNPVASVTATSKYFLIVTDSAGTTSTDSITITVGTVYPTGSISPPNPNICEGQNVTMTASGGNSYLWSTGETTPAIVDFPPTGATTYAVTVTLDGCTDTAFTTVNSYTRPNVSVTPGSATICDDDSVTLVASGASSYTWIPPTGLSSTTDSVTVASPASTTTYSVTGSNAHCAGNPTSVTITVGVTPTASITPASPEICEGESVTLTASGGGSYSWSTGGTNASISPSPGPGTTDYTVVVSDNGCLDTASVTVTTQALPIVTVSPGSPTICDTASVTLTASGADSYTWSPSTDLSSVTIPNPVASPNSTTTYTVVGETGNCESAPVLVTVTVTTCVGIYEIAQSITNIFPNPARDMVNVRFDAGLSADAVLFLVTADGSIMKESHIAIVPGENIFTIHTEQLAKGLYIIKIKSDRFTATGSVIIK